MEGSLSLVYYCFIVIVAREQMFQQISVAEGILWIAIVAAHSASAADVSAMNAIEHAYHPCWGGDFFCRFLLPP
jgi:hypothetical protein